MAYKLQFPESIKSHQVLHVSGLKIYNTDKADLPKPPPVLIDDVEEYEVEKVLDARIYRRKQQYLVKWLGYEMYDSTWEPEENLLNASELIKDYWEEHQNKDGKMGECNIVTVCTFSD